MPHAGCFGSGMQEHQVSATLSEVGVLIWLGQGKQKVQLREQLLWGSDREQDAHQSPKSWDSSLPILQIVCSSISRLMQCMGETVGVESMVRDG